MAHTEVFAGARINLDPTLPCDQITDVDWDFDDDKIFMYRTVLYSEEKGLVGEASPNAYPLMASFQPRTASPTTAATLVLRAKGVGGGADIERSYPYNVSMPVLVGAHEVETWGDDVTEHQSKVGGGEYRPFIGMVQDHIKESGVRINFPCTRVSRDGRGKVYVIQLIKSLAQVLKDGTIIETLSDTKNEFILDTSFPYVEEELARDESEVLPFYDNPGIFTDYKHMRQEGVEITDTAHFRTYVLYQEDPREASNTVLLTAPLMWGYRWSARYDGATGKFNTFDVKLDPPKVIADDQDRPIDLFLPTWQGITKLLQ